MIGGPGSDRLFGGDNGLVPQFEDAPSPVGDTLVPGPGDDLVDLGANTVVAGDYSSADTLDLTDAAAGVTLDLVAGTAVGEGTDVVVVPAPASSEGPAVEVLGSVHADRILGTEGNDHLVGQGGGDWIEGRGGDDLVMNAWDEYSPTPGEDADDHFDGGPGADFVDSTGGTDTLLGGDGADHVRKSGGATTIDAGPGRDEVDVYLSRRPAHRHRWRVAATTSRSPCSAASAARAVSSTTARAVPACATRTAAAPGPSCRRRSRSPCRTTPAVDLPRHPGGRPRRRRGGVHRRGRGGDDVLIGSYADDVLLGGKGRDRVVGGRGEDRCRGEELVGCELRGAS